MLLPVVIWWTLGNKDPVGPTGEGSDKGQVSEMRARSVMAGATDHSQPPPFPTRPPSPIGGERSAELLFHSWGDGRSPTETAAQRGSVPQEALLFTHPPQWLPVSEHCLLFHTACAHVHMWVCKGGGWDEERWPHRKKCVGLLICPAGLRRKGKGYCLYME